MRIIICLEVCGDFLPFSRFGENPLLVSINTAPPPKPPRHFGICTVAHNCKLKVLSITEFLNVEFFKFNYIFMFIPNLSFATSWR